MSISGALEVDDTLSVAEGSTAVWLVAQLSSMSNSGSWSICHHLPSYHIFVGEQLLSYFPVTASSGSDGLSSGTTGPTERLRRVDSPCVTRRLMLEGTILASSKQIEPPQLDQW